MDFQREIFEKASSWWRPHLNAGLPGVHVGVDEARHHDEMTTIHLFHVVLGRQGAADSFDDLIPSMRMSPRMTSSEPPRMVRTTASLIRVALIRSFPFR